MEPERDPALPPELVAHLDGSDLDAKVGWTALLVTTDADGIPHVALLSVGELLAPRFDRLYVALWPTSTTTANLAVRRSGLLVAAHDGGALKARLSVHDSGHLDGPPRLTWFGTRVEAVSLDRVPYARLVNLAHFELESASPLERWRTTLEQLAATGDQPG